MIRHVVAFKWNDDVDSAHIAATAAGLDHLAATIPGVRRYQHGPDLELGADNLDYVVVGDFDTVADYEVYRDHPTHKEFIARHIAGRIAQRAAVQYEI